MAESGSVYIPVNMDVSQAEKNWDKFVKKMMDSETQIGEIEAKLDALTEGDLANDPETGKEVERLLKQQDAAKQNADAYRMLSEAYGQYLAKLREQQAAQAAQTPQETFLDKLQYGLETFVETGQSAMVAVGNAGKTAFQGIGNVIKGVGSGIGKVFMAPIHKAEGFLKRIGTRLRRITMNMFLFNMISKAMRSVSQYLGQAFQKSTEMNAAMARLKGATQAMMQPLLKILIPVLTKIVNFITLIVQKIGSFLALLTGSTWSDSVAGAKEVAGSMDDAAGSAKDMKKSLAGFDQINTLDDNSSGGGKSGGVGADFSGIADIGTLDWSGILDKVHEVVRKIIDAIQGVNWQELGAKVWTTITEFFGGLNYSRYLQDMFELIGSALGAITGFLWGILKTAWNNLMEYFAPFVKENGGNVILGFLQGMYEAIKNIGKWIWDNILQPFLTGFKRAFGISSPAKVTEELGEMVVQGFYNGVKGIWNAVKSVFTNLVTQIRTSFTNVWSTLTTGARNAWTSIQNTFSSVATFFQNTFSNAWKKVKSVFSGNNFSGIIDSISAAFKSLLNSFISGINKVVDSPFRVLKNAFDKLRELKVGTLQPFTWLPQITIPSIPYLAKGGLIPPNREFTAVLGDNKREPEIVSPVSAMKQAMIEALQEMSVGGNVTVVLEGDAKALFKVVQKQARSYAAQTGVAAF